MSFGDPGRGRTLFVILGVLFGKVGVASAAQVVVFDSHWVHTASIPDSHYRQVPVSGTPKNWVAPVNYAGGSAWVSLEVLAKPTDEPTKFQVCFEATPSYGCTAQSAAYTTTGRLEWETPFSSFYIPPNETVDWTKGTNTIVAILKDTMNGKPSADNVGATAAARFTPTEVRIVVTLVSPGGTYTRPAPYSRPPADAGAGDAESDASAGGSSSPGGAPGVRDAGRPPSSGGVTGAGGTSDRGGSGGVAGSPALSGGNPGAGGGSSGVGNARSGSSLPDASATSSGERTGSSGCEVTPPSRRSSGVDVLLLAIAASALGRRRSAGARRAQRNGFV